MSPSSSFRPVGIATPVVEATGGLVSALVLGTASAIRGARAFHPDGRSFHATVDLDGGSWEAPLLDEPARRRAVVRLSRGVGTPEPAPDVLGLALRVLDAHGEGRHQDLLLVTSGARPVLRHTFAPARSFDHPSWSSVLPYRVGGRTLLFGAEPIRSTGGPAVRLTDVSSDVVAARLRYALTVAEPAGPWQRVGVVEFGAQLGAAENESLRFNAANAGGGIEPVGVLQALRRVTYASSQAARPTP